MPRPAHSWNRRGTRHFRSVECNCHEVASCAARRRNKSTVACSVRLNRPRNTGAHTLMALRVLVAEDEALVALALADLLDAEGYAVTLAPDGLKALEAARLLGGDLAVLVTDLNMPGMMGEDLIRALRAEQSGLPVVVVTGSPPIGGLEKLHRHGGGHGPMHLLHKPVDFDALFETLRR